MSFECRLRSRRIRWAHDVCLSPRSAWLTVMVSYYPALPRCGRCSIMISGILILKTCWDVM